MSEFTRDLSILEAWLSEHTKLGPHCEISSCRRPKTGFSADTLLLTVTNVRAEDRHIVIRIDHPARTLFLDSTIERQARMMTLLAEHDISVPAVLGWTNDCAPLGAPFLVMEHVDAVSLPQHPSYHISGLLMDLGPEGRNRAWQSALSTMGRINRIDWRHSAEFLMDPSYGDPGLDHYLGWLRAWRNSAFDGEHPIIDPALDLLDADRPIKAHAELLWGDSNPGNFLFRSDGSVAASLDFEAAAIGPAEIDISNWFVIDRMLASGNCLPQGMPDKVEQIRIFERALGRPVQNLSYFEIMAATRMAIIVANLTQTLARDGLIASESLGGVHNPICSMLAEMIGKQHVGDMGDYMDVIAVMNNR